MNTIDENRRATGASEPVLAPVLANNRFVWAVGSYRECYPDMPEDLGLVLWDRQRGQASRDRG